MSLVSAAIRGDIEMVKWLVSIGVNPRENDDEAIREAAVNLRLDVVKYLATVGCDPTALDNWALRILDYGRPYRKGYNEMVIFLMRAGGFNLDDYVFVEEEDELDFSLLVIN